MIKKILIVSLSGFQYGYNATIIAGAILFITTVFSLTPFQEGLAVSMFLFSASVSSFFAGNLANYLGRKKSLMLASLLFFIGAMISTAAVNYELLLIGRFLTGLGAGITTVVAPIYLAEIAPTSKRGSIVHANQISMATGLLLAYLCNYLLSFSQDWRLMFGFGVVFAIIQSIGLFFIPESISQVNIDSLKKSAWKQLFKPEYRSRLTMGTMLAIFQQITGISAVVYFAPRIFQDAGYATASEATLASITIGIMTLGAIMISFWLVDRVGRRPLLLWSLLGMSANLLIISSLFFFQPSFLNTVIMISIMIYIASYSVGIGPVTPLIVAEIFPLSVRSYASTFTGCIGWVVNFLVALTFLDLTDLLTPAGAFLLYAGLGVFALLFFFKRFSETKNQDLEEV